MITCNELDIDRLRRILKYDSRTGVFTWKINICNVKAGTVAGTLHHSGYRTITIGGKRRLAHRLAYAMHHGKWPKGCIDHINRVKDDNRISNLRDVSTSVNSHNSGIGALNTSGYRGVGYVKKTGKWRARIVLEGKEIHLGMFDTPEEAGKARKAFADTLTVHPHTGRLIAVKDDYLE